MSGDVVGREPGGAMSAPMQRAMVARAEAVVLLGDIRASLTRWSKVLEEVELALPSAELSSLDEQAALVAARDRLFNVLAEISTLADPFAVWAAVAPDGADPS